MGLTAGRLHVCVGDGGFDSVHATLIGGPQAVGLEVGPTLPEDGLTLRRGLERAWVTVADSPWDQYLVDADVRRRLAQAIGGLVVATEVWDSDHAGVTLFVDGTSDGPVWFPVSANRVAETFEPWTELWLDGVGSEEIKAAAVGRRVLAEDHLIEILALVGIDATAVVDELTASAGGQVVSLARWRRPASPPPAPEPASEVPVLSVGSSRTMVFLEGNTFEETLHVHNEGGRASGLRVSVRGLALDSGILALDTIAMGQPLTTDTVPAGRPIAEATAVWERPSIDLAAAVPSNGHGPAFALVLSGRAEQSGRGTLDLTISTRAPESVPATAQVAVHVLGADDIPLGCSDPTRYRYQCAYLVDPDDLVACFVVDPTHITSTQLVELFERFFLVPGLLAADEPISVSSLGETKAIGIKTLRARDIAQVPRWAKLVPALHHVPDLRIRSPLTAGVVFTRGDQDRHDVNDAHHAPTILNFTVKLRRVAPETATEVESELKRAGDDLLAAGSLVQGFCDRWGQGDVIATRAYSRATPWAARTSAGPYFFSAAWARRYLYAVASTTWLGADLTHYAGPDLATISDLITHGSRGIRIDAPNGANRRRVERSIPAIVPGLGELDPRFAS